MKGILRRRPQVLLAVRFPLEDPCCTTDISHGDDAALALVYLPRGNVCDALRFETL